MSDLKAQYERKLKLIVEMGLSNYPAPHTEEMIALEIKAATLILRFLGVPRGD
jgi:hypothetical protein